MRGIELYSKFYPVFPQKSKMKIFKIVQTHYQTLGIISSHDLIEKRPLSKKVLFGFLLFGYSAASQLVYIFHLASSFVDYVDSICSLCGSIIVFICFATTAFKRTLLSESINNLEKFIDTSVLFSNHYIRFVELNWLLIVKIYLFFRIKISEIKKILLKKQSTVRTIE